MGSETLNDKSQYLYDGKWHDLEVKEEVIKVRFGSDVIHKVKLTRNGVMIGRDFLNHAAGDLTPFSP